MKELLMKQTVAMTTVFGKNPVIFACVALRFECFFIQCESLGAYEPGTAPMLVTKTDPVEKQKDPNVPKRFHYVDEAHQAALSFRKWYATGDAGQLWRLHRCCEYTVGMKFGENKSSFERPEKVLSYCKHFSVVVKDESEPTLSDTSGTW